MHITFRSIFVTMSFITLMTLPPVAAAADPVPAAGPASSDLKPAAKDPVPPASPAAPNSSTPASVPSPTSKPETSLPAAGAPSLSAPAVKIGFVDIVRISQQSKEGKATQIRLKAKKDKFESQIKAKQKQLEKQKGAIEAKLPTMSPETRAAKAKEFEKKVEDFRKLVLKAENEMKPLIEEANRALYQKIQQAAAAYGKANGFTVIATLKDFLYLGTATLPEDVTDGVLKQMDEK